MIEVTTPLVAVVGYKRSKLAPMGGQRVLVVRDGFLRILGKQGRIDLDVPVQQATARLTVTRTVELRANKSSAIVYGFSQLSAVPRELQQLAHDQSLGAEFIGLTATGAKTSRVLVEGLHRRGVAQG
ncbi:MAG: hypothetical protein ACRDMV_14715 [Streptosporangiales bacterium]